MRFIRPGWIVLLASLASGCQRDAGPAHGPGSAGESAQGVVEARGLHNVHRVSDKLFSGSSPEGDAGFESLKELGVRTVLSVDGARPDVELARKHGLRYVHLPIGYDGVPQEQASRLARAVRDLPGPVYLHCHHGKHRGPAAAAVVRLFLDPECGVEDAVAVMKQAGTDPRYKGLYAAPAALRRPTKAELDLVPDEFPETARVAATAQVMVSIDERWEHLKQVRAAGWRAPRDHPDIDPPHEALQLAEHYRELARLPATKARPDEYRRLLAGAEKEAVALESVLRAGKAAGKVDATAAGVAFEKAVASCANCHARYRDVPQR